MARYKALDALYGELLGRYISRYDLKSSMESDRMRLMLMSIMEKYNFEKALMSLMKYDNSHRNTCDDYTLIINKQTEAYLRYLHFLTLGYSDFALSAFLMIKKTGNKTPWKDINNMQIHPGYMVKQILGQDDIKNFLSHLYTSGLVFTNSITRKNCGPASLLDFTQYLQGVLKSSRFDNEGFVGRNMAKIMGINPSRGVQTLIDSAVLPIAIKIAKLGMLTSFLKFSTHCKSVLLADASVSITLPTGSYSSDEASAQAIMWHSDWHGSSFLKVFIPLIDFTAGSGSHAYLVNTHIKKPSFYQDRRYFDSEIDEFDASGIVVHSAKVGDVIYEDTTGLHKGTTGHSGVRAILTLVYQNHYVVDHTIKSRSTHLINLS